MPIGDIHNAMTALRSDLYVDKHVTNDKCSSLISVCFGRQ